MSQDPRCDTCRFWDPDPDGESGWCQKVHDSPQFMIHFDESDQAELVTRKTHSCAEWETEGPLEAVEPIGY